jgi:hypothetical protein
MYESYKQLEGLLGRGSTHRCSSTYTEQHKQKETQTHIHVSGEIRTYDPSVQAVGDSAILR